MPRQDPDDGDELIELRRDSIWEEPRAAPKYLPERMTQEELLAWYSYHIRDQSVPLRLRTALADKMSQMLRMTGPTQVTNVVNHASAHFHASPTPQTNEEARALVQRLRNRFERLPQARPTPALSEPPTVIQATQPTQAKKTT